MTTTKLDEKQVVWAIGEEPNIKTEIKSLELNLKTETGQCQKSPQISCGSVHVINHASCLFAKAIQGETNLQLLIDTGSPVSVLNKTQFDTLGLQSNLENVDSALYTANGNPLDVYGKQSLEIVVGNHKFEQVFIIGNVDGIDGILGTDFLEKYDMDILIRKRKLKFRKGTIKLFQKSKKTLNFRYFSYKRD